MRIGIAFDLARAPDADGPDDRFEEFDRPETVEAIAEVIRGEGHEVSLLGDGREFLARVLADPPDFVFNIAEGEGVGRCREARVPAVLEMLGIPYSGSDPLTLSACLDKEMAKRLVASGSSVNSPGSRTLPGVCDEVHEHLLRMIFDHPEIQITPWPARRPGPLILKPAFEGSSKGIRGNCLAESADEAVAIYRSLARDYAQPILAEDYIEGDEVTVGVVGNSDFTGRAGVSFGPFAFGVMRIVPKESSGRFVYSLEVKRDWRNRVRYEAPPDLPDPLVSNIVLAALSVYKALECRDVARIDFRVRDGVPYFIEANPLPGLAPGVGDLVILAEGHGIGYAELIRKILRASLARVGLT